eukprot:GHVS01044902.1.p1 GENE.GHVS01044902.1~~GHVS01044902.1.p1  ORF type:complete len:136 (+),score=29.92 GHVS01044902.1:142-549(+)
MSQLHEEKQRLFTDVFAEIDSRDHCVDLPGAGPIPSRELQEKLQSATEKAETTVLDRNKADCVNQRTYQHAAAAYSRNEEFKKLKSALEELHSDAVVGIMRPKDRRRTQDAPRIEEIVEETKSADNGGEKKEENA